MGGISRAWTAVFGIGLIMMAIALYYQHVLDIQPCINCIYARFGVVGLIIISCLGMMLHRFNWIQPIVAVLAGGVAMALGEVAYELVSIERGWSIGGCMFDIGLPDWFALDEWMPALFMPYEPCSKTPSLLFGITMAEALLAAAVLLGILCVIKLLSATARLIKR